MSDKPKRIQLRRTKGWNKPEGTIVVSRPSKWGNPFPVGEDATHYFGDGFEKITAEQAVYCFREWLELGLIGGGPPGERPDLSELRGKDLCCWCKPGDPCHADVLLELANK